MYFYVIMPVGSDINFEVKRSIIKKVAIGQDVDPHFPYDRANYERFDLERTLSILRDAEFVLADLSFERPSSYFEVGLAQALGKEVYLMAEQGTDIHQANGRDLTRFYSDLQSYENAISAIVKDALDKAPIRNTLSPIAKEPTHALP